MGMMTTIMAVKSDGTGAAVWANVDGMINKYVRLAPNPSTTQQLQGSINDDQSDAFNIGSAQASTAAWFAVPDTVKWLRWNCTAGAGGNPVSKVVGTPG
jgi:hypothetical protein